MGVELLINDLWRGKRSWVDERRSLEETGPAYIILVYTERLEIC